MPKRPERQARLQTFPRLMEVLVKRAEGVRAGVRTSVAALLSTPREAPESGTLQATEAAEDNVVSAPSPPLSRVAPSTPPPPRSGGENGDEPVYATVEEELAALNKQVRRLGNYKKNLTQQLDMLAERLALSESIVHNVPEPLLVVELDGIISYCNERASELTGWSRKEVEGKLRESDVWSHAKGDESLLKACLDQKVTLTGVKKELKNRAGEPVQVVVSATPRKTSLGEVKGAFAIYRDISVEERLTRELLEAGRGVTDVHTTATEILTGAQEQATAATEQATTVNQVSTTATELASSANQVAESCDAIAGSAEQLLDSARTGQSLLEDVLLKMQMLKEMTRSAGDHAFGLGEKSRRVDAVVDLIGKIASETKLIAFNAAIEAARAGDAGRGFAVVADEVKSLAESVSASSKEIKAIVGDIQSSINGSILNAEGQGKLVEDVSNQAQQSNGSFGAIVHDIEDVADSARVISASARQQQLATEQLTISMEELNHAAGYSAESAKQTTSAVSQLTAFAKRLSEALARFRAV